jgi:hypothetical protein
MKVGITLPNLGPQATRENVLQTHTRSMYVAPSHNMSNAALYFHMWFVDEF